MYAARRFVPHSEILSHTEDIGYVLKADNNCNLNTVCSQWSVFLCQYGYDSIGWLVLFFAHIILFNILSSRKTPLPYHGIVMSTTVKIGFIVMILEYLVQFIHFGIGSYSYCSWYNVNTLILSLIVNYFFYLGLYTKIRKRHLMCVTLHILFYLLLIYHYTLPTFLLMLVYPMKVIIIVAYLIAFVYIPIIVFPISLLIFKHVVKTLKYKRICIRVCAHIYLLYIPLYVFIICLFLIVLFLVVYVLLLNQSLSFTIGPVYTVLSLIPTAAISFVSWMLKTKVFQLEEIKNAEDTNEQIAANNDSDSEEEHIPLLTVDENSSTSEPMSESSPNLHNRHNYGTTEAEDKSSETNC